MSFLAGYRFSRCIGRQLIPLAALALCAATAAAEPPAQVPGTEPLTMEGDIASQLVAGVDKFLLRKIEESTEKRARHWNRDFSSPEAYSQSIEPNRKRLAHILGVRDQRVAFDAPELVATTEHAGLVGEGKGYRIYAVRWPVLQAGPGRETIHGEGLLLVPTDREPLADVVALPDCEQSPEQLCGLAEGIDVEAQFARVLAEQGCRVLIPTVITRQRGLYASAGGYGGNLPAREFLYRSAFELGRHLIGYEVQKVLAAVDWFEREAKAKDANKTEPPRIAVVGYGEGGLLALYAGALDPRIQAVGISGYFDNRNNIWQEPLDRNVFGLLDEFGDAELASMIVAPRRIVIEMCRGPETTITGHGGAAPAVLLSPTDVVASQECERVGKFKSHLNKEQKSKFDESLIGVQGSPPIENPGGGGFLVTVLSGYDELDGKRLSIVASKDLPKPTGKLPDAQKRMQRQIGEIDAFNQHILRESPYVRKAYFRPDTSSLEAYEKSIESYRQHFAEEVIGRFDDERLPFNARTRLAYDEEKWTGYEVVLDVYPDVIAYGLLILPKDLKPGEKRPVVVCQHGLEGRPQDTVGEPSYHYYKAFASKLAERGFITFAPQNLYIFQDRFRTLQRKAYPLKKTLFSVIVPQHQQIVDWLKTQPNVDPERIGFYGLSYGGKSAMRIPPLVPDYCLSICSADFNEWVDKNASTRSGHSYVPSGEYEIFEFDLGSTFNYTEMAGLIAPRPFMVERGHYDVVASDETVGHEFAKVQFLYNAKLKIPERCEIEWFDGPHTINAQGTFRFLHKHLNWPEPAMSDE